ncbi:hypothetical protein EDD21DRAFT_142970 [Dissophora ornata]|nr:hypothetical protein EDD21DRAFT_142970 [Dissophora ornata]
MLTCTSSNVIRLYVLVALTAPSFMAVAAPITPSTLGTSSGASAAAAAPESASSTTSASGASSGSGPVSSLFVVAPPIYTSANPSSTSFQAQNQAQAPSSSISKRCSGDDCSHDDHWGDCCCDDCWDDSCCDDWWNDCCDDHHHGCCS